MVSLRASWAQPPSIAGSAPATRSRLRRTRVALFAPHTCTALQLTPRIRSRYASSSGQADGGRGWQGASADSMSPEGRPGLEYGIVGGQPDQKRVSELAGCNTANTTSYRVPSAARSRHRPDASASKEQLSTVAVLDARRRLTITKPDSF